MSDRALDARAAAVTWHQVEDHEVVAAGQRLLEGRLPVLDRVDLVALCAERVRERVEDRRLVLSDQEPPHRETSLAAGRASASTRHGSLPFSSSASRASAR